MKATVSKNDLRDALARVINAVAVKPSTPVIAGIYLQANDDSSLTIRATNFSLDITAKIPANVEVEGATVVMGKYFNTIANKLGGDIVTLQTENNQLKIKSEAASFDILTMDAGDFPAAQKFDGETSFRINKNALRELIRRTAFACAKEDSRPVFTGVNFALDGIKITAAATNTSRIAIARDSIFDETEASFIVSASTLRILQNAFDADTVIKVTLDKNSAAFEFDNFKIITRLIDGEFPPYDKIIPATCATTAEVDVAELRTAIERMQVISSSNEYNQIRMIFTQDGLEISASSDDIGKAIEHVDAKVTGGDLKIAFKAEYILDVLKIFGVKVCKFGMNETLTPALITADGEDFTYIATPLRTH